MKYFTQQKHLVEIAISSNGNWDGVFKKRTSKIFGRQPLKKLKYAVYLNRLYHFKFFKGCPPQILLSPYLYSIEIGSNYMMLLSFVNLNYIWY